MTSDTADRVTHAIATQIYALMVERQITQGELTRRSGLCHQTVSALLCGRYPGSVRTIARLLDALDAEMRVTVEARHTD